MIYKVIYPFIEDGKKYWSGDTYQNDDEKRIKALTSTENKLKKVLIEANSTDEKSKTIKKSKADEATKKVDGAPEVGTKGENK